MDERDASPLSLSLTPMQMAFLVSLLPGPRRTDDCQDAITVGGLLRLNLIVWDEPDHWLNGRRRRDTFALSEVGRRTLDRRLPNS